MPPELDIYGITRFRDETTINRFVDAHVDRLASEDRGDEELMLFPLTNTAEQNLDFDDYDWEPALTLTHIIERGLQIPRRAFTVYLKSNDRSIDRAILSFTTDDQLIVGLAIDDTGMQPANTVRAKHILEMLLEDFMCHAGLIVVENPPPANYAEFLAQLTSPLTIYHKGSNTLKKNRA